LLEKEIEIDLY